MSDKLNIKFTKTLGSFHLEVNHAVPMDGITAIFGPSGAGKSTLLRLIAGFETAETGHLSLGETVWFDKADKINIAPHKRSVGYMFQDGRLFPHLSVKQNLEFAMRRAGHSITLDDVTAAFDISGLMQALPQTLSGGEQRRVALARTVLTGPDILLLDEPLTGLDRARKRDILPFIERLPHVFNIPCLLVSHDIEEVSRLADSIMTMSGGRISDFGDAPQILSQIDQTPLAKDYDVSSLFESRITAHDKHIHMMEADIAGDPIQLPAVKNAEIGNTLRLRIRASDVAIALSPPTGVSIRNILPADIIDIAADDSASYAILTLGLKAGQLKARITRAALMELDLQAVMQVHAMIKSISFEGRL